MAASLALCQVLKGIWRCPESVIAVWHPQRFMCLELSQCLSSALQMHIWLARPGEYTGPQWPIHQHNWSLLSYVICGSIENKLYTVRSCQSGFTHRIYIVAYYQGINRLRPTNKLTCCEEVRCEVIANGNYYELRPGTYHSVNVSEGKVAATLTVSRKVDNRSAKVLGPIEKGRILTSSRVRCQDNVVRHAVGLVLKRISNND